jgi:hypothetical protein
MKIHPHQRPGAFRDGQSGETAFAKFVQDIDMTAEVVKFAGPLKEMTAPARSVSPSHHDSQRESRAKDRLQ